MKYLRIIKYIILLMFPFGVYAQNSIKIYGRVDTSFLKRYNTQELTVRINKNATKNVRGIIYKIPIDMYGNFIFDFDLTDSLAYFSFEFQDNKPSNNIGNYYNISEPARTNPLNEMYLFSRGDSVKISFRSDNFIQFSGRGSAKLNCQFQTYNMFSLPFPVLNRSISLENKGELRKSILLETEILKTQGQQLVSLLKSYKDEIGDDIYNLLYLDAISILKHQIFFKLPNYYLRFPKKQDQLIIQEYFKYVNNLNFEKNTVNEKLTTISAYYSPAILEKESTELVLFNENRNTYRVFSFEKLYNNLKKKYDGLLRDNLILLCFENYVYGKSDDAKKMYPDAINVISNNITRKILEQLMVKYTDTAYPFVFYDMDNKPHKLQDYNGKLIVMDFWFTSCIACTMVAEAMHPIFQKYKNRNDIVFITVSTDLMDKWLESLKTERYTSKGMVNLHTNGKGFKDPMISFYGFTTFPKQLIIGKKGQLITASPPRPDVGMENILKLEKLIEENLK